MDHRDVYTEKIIKRSPDGLAILKKAGIILGVIILPLVFLLIEYVAFLFPAILIACIWFGYRFFRMQDVEYEYIVTNGEIDIDKIMGQAKRKRVVTANARQFEAFGPMDKEHEREYGAEGIQKVYDVAVSKRSPKRWFAVFQGKDGKRSLLILEEDQRVLDALKPFIPRRVYFER